MTLSVDDMACFLPGCSEFGDVDDSLCKGLRCFLRQVVPDAARDESVHVLAGEFGGIGAGLRMRRAVRVAFQRNRWHCDDWGFGKPRLEIVIFWLTRGETEPPAIVIYHDGDMVGVV